MSGRGRSRAGSRCSAATGELAELEALVCAERVVLLHAPTGAGKSSLIQAGLVPRLRRRFDLRRPTRVGQPLAPDVPGDSNRYAVAAMLGLERGVPDALRRPAGRLAGLRLAEYVAGRPRRRGAPTEVLLVFDQFEEVLHVDPLALAAKWAFFADLPGRPRGDEGERPLPPLPPRGLVVGAGGPRGLRRTPCSRRRPSTDAVQPAWRPRARRLRLA